MYLIDWNFFDMIWCIHYANYKNRVEPLKSELYRVGITASGKLSWHYTFDTVFNNIFFDVTKKINSNHAKNTNVLSCTLAHYHCIKASYSLGCNNVLIMEDDIRFLNDTNEIRKAIDMIPPDGDIVLFDTLPANKDKYRKYVTDMKYNDFFAEYVDDINSCGCYMLGRRGMRAMIEVYEHSVEASDFYTNMLTMEHGIRKYFAINPITCQCQYSDSNNIKIYGNSSFELPYKISGIDFSNYNMGDANEKG